MNAGQSFKLIDIVYEPVILIARFASPVREGIFSPKKGSELR